MLVHERSVMASPKKLDHKTDFSELVKLVSKAKGNKTRAQFAEETGLSLAYISKLLHNKLDKPPIVNTLKKIAGTTDEVAYAELLDAAGYNPHKYVEENEYKTFT